MAWTVPLAVAVIFGDASAEARSRSPTPLDVIVNPIGALFNGVGNAVGQAARPLRRHERRAPRVERTAPAAPAAIPAAAPATTAQTTGDKAPLWPNAYDNAIGFALWNDDGTRLWAHGYGDLLATIFQPAAPASGPRADETAKARADLCATPPADSAAAIMDRIAHEVNPEAAQQAAIERLRAALVTAFDAIKGACAEAFSPHAADRLQVTIDRLWALHVAGYVLRDPLQAFYDTLNPDQKARLDSVADGGKVQNLASRPDEAADMAKIEKTAARATDGTGATSADAGAQQCLAVTLRAPSWPTKDIERKVALTAPQRAQLASLAKLSDQMQKSLLATCPQQTPTTVPARFDAALDRFDGLFFAAATLQPAFDGFYRSLRPEQKAQFDEAIR
jgi:hypothetical protein